MITLSFSTINSCLQPNNSHNWVNKQIGRKVPESEAMKIGKEIHRIIQARIQTGDYEELRGFSVETEDFDERMKVRMFLPPVRQGFDGLSDLLAGVSKYEIMGFVDGRRGSELLEIKTGTDFWPITKFRNSMQVGLYALATGSRKVFCMTALSNMGLWKMQPPKIYEIDITKQMKEKALKWIEDAISLYEKGEFTGGLTDGKCEGYCLYGNNCYFK